MNSSDRSSTRRTPTVRTSVAETGRHPGIASGRVRFDDRGNAKWEMRTPGHTYVADASTTLVRKLVPPLSLEATARLPKMPFAGGQDSKPQPAQPDVRPDRTERTLTKAEMGTVRTFPVARKTVAAKSGRAAEARTGARPAGLIARLLGRKP
jgi:hypothetical protein